MALSDLFSGRPAQTLQFQRFTPQQQGLQNQSIQQALAMLQGQPQDYSKGFAPIAQQAKTQFQQQTIPTLAERFSSLGNNALSSPAFASQLGQAGAGLSENLAAMQAQYGLQKQGLEQNQLSNLLQFGLQPSFQSLYLPQTQGGFSNFLGNLGGGLGQVGPLYLLLKLLGGS